MIENADIIGDESGFDPSTTDMTLLKQNDQSIYLLKENGIFVNELQADVTFNGKKIWANLPSGFLEEDLVGVTFRLYQFISGNEPDYVTNTQIVEDGTYHLMGKDGNKSKEYASIEIKNWQDQKYKGEYNFSIKYQGKNTNTVNPTNGSIEVKGEENALTIPKYDDDGKLYAYVIRESGDFSGTDVDGNIGLVFKQPSINNYAITNPYDTSKGSITVKKILDTEKYSGTTTNPSVTFTLTRQYKDTQSEDLITDTVFKQTQTIKYSEFVDNSKEISFTDLEIYAPNGNKYVYTVTENENDLIQGGYKVYAGNGNLDSDSAGLQECQNGVYEVTDVYPKEDTSVGQQLLNFFNTIPQLLGITPRETDTSYATFKNQYDAKLVPLYFGKTWTDANNESGVRLKELTFALQRKADAQPGQNNSITNSTIGQFKIDLTKFWNQTEAALIRDNGLNIVNGDLDFIKKVTVTSKDGTNLSSASNWIIKVESVADFAPNGMPWTYSIQEMNVSWPYTGTGAFTVSYVKPTGEETDGYFGDENNPTSVTNSILVRNVIWKNWRFSGAKDESFKNPLGYDMTVTYTLYLAAEEITDPASTTTEPQGWLTEPSLWKVANTSPYWESIKNYNSNATGTTSSFYGKDATLGAKTGASSASISNLPRVIKKDNKVYALHYYLIETGLTLSDTDSNNTKRTIYEETFIPHFKSMTDPAHVSYKGKSTVGFWLETKAVIREGDNFVKSSVILVTPQVNSETILNKVWKEGYKTVLDPNGLNADTDMAPWPLLNEVNNAKRECTTINILDLTQLKVNKTWVDDQDNIYGTREPNGTDKWQLTFQLQRSAKDQGNWQNVNGKTVTVSGEDKESTKDGTFTLLPVKVLEQTADGVYSITEYKYRAREKDDETVVEDDGTYRDAYKATYEDDETIENVYTTNATNKMETIDLYAHKNWDDPSLSSPVTFELQYQSGTDSNGNPIWKSFDTKATVTLDGTANDEEAYYEYEGWKAKWIGVPKVMPGSITTGEGENKQTNYRIVEVTDNAYGSVSNGTLAGTGTQNDPYVLVGGGTSDNPYTITNELTELKVEKIVEKYVDGATVDKVFSFTITGDMSNVKYQKYTKNASEADDRVGELVKISSGGTFTLQDNQYVIFYGLKKGKAYTISETVTNGYSPTFTVRNATGTTSKVANDTVAIPNTKAEKVPTMSIENQYYGKLTIQKKDEDGNSLAGVSFKLQRNDGTQSSPDWESVGEYTTDSTGEVIFNNLILKKQYQIVEVSVPSGYNKLATPIEITLPYESTENGSVDPLYEIGGKKYYAEVTVKIENNKSMVLPTTAGPGFYWPGLIGATSLMTGGMIYYQVDKRRTRRKKL